MQTTPLLRKYLVVGTVLLFIGTAIIPSFGQQTDKPSSPSSRENWLYVGGSGPGNYSTIQSAINNASDGDTVFVYSGTYPTSSFIIDKEIRLLGENKNTTIVESPSNAKVSIKSYTNHVAINKFTFQNFAIETQYNNNISISDNIFLTAIYYGTPWVIYSSGSFNTFKGNTIILRYTTEEESGPQECMGLNEYHSTIVNNILVGAADCGLTIGGVPPEYAQCGLNTISGNTFSNNKRGLFLSPYVTSLGKDLITQNNFINNSLQAGFVISVVHPFDLIHAILSQHRLPFSQWDSNYWDDYTGNFGRKIPGKIEFFSTKFMIPVRNVDRHPAHGPLYLKNELSSTTSDGISNVMQKYSFSTLTWGDWLPDWPGRYEPFFKVKDIISFGQTAWGLTTADFNKDGKLDFAVSWATSPWTQSTISLMYSNGKGGFTRNDVYTIKAPALRYFIDLNSGDYDNDGDIDLLFTYDNKNTQVGTVCLLLNNGDNQFDTVKVITNLLPVNEWGRDNPNICSADFDNDGDLDFLVGDNSGLVAFYTNNGTGGFSNVGTYDFGGLMSWGLSAADFNNDGTIDFIVTEDKYTNPNVGFIYLVFNDDTSSCFNQSHAVKIADIPPRPSFFTDVLWGYGCLCSLDYNNDGLMDFVFAPSDCVFLYMQNQSGMFDSVHVMSLPLPYGGNFTWYIDDLREGGITSGDFNGDGLDDMVIGGVQGVARICYNQRVLVDIVCPDNDSVYRNNVKTIGLIPIFPFIRHGTSIAIGDLTVKVKGLVPLQKVEFYLGSKLVYTDDTAPYEWNWTSFSFGRHKIKALAYDMDGKQAGSDDAIVWKYF